MDTICTYHDNRDEILISYLYDDIDPADREAFAKHLAACTVCRRELDELGVARGLLEQWRPPETLDRAFANPTFSSGSQKARPAAAWKKLGDIPAWAQVAAAMLFLGVSLAVANLDVTYNRNGLSVRTGWMSPSSAAAGAGASAPVTNDGAAAASTVTRGNTSTSAGQVGSQDQQAPWRADLVRFEQQLRSEMRSSASQPAARAAVRSNADVELVLGRVRALIEESEQRQQRELALRIAEVDSHVQAQRFADLRNIDRNLTAIQSNTGVDMRRLYKMTNDLAVRVSQAR